ncbi:hypothetical protein KR215_004620 [Drosophila sulfurigaster]|nr:hypothetical protein KR215_004620 [Drosophila sulfurigaster]
MCIKNCAHIQFGCSDSSSNNNNSNNNNNTLNNNDNVSKESEENVSRLEYQFQLQLPRKSAKGGKLSSLKIFMCCCYFIIIIMLI